MNKELHPMTSDQFPRKGGSGSGSIPCYSVEARIVGTKVKEIGEMILHSDWQRVNFQKCGVGQIGIPCEALTERAYRGHGLLSYAQAQGLRWWFHAQLTHAYGLETRIIKHIINHSYQETVEGAFDYVGGESVNYCRPDFEKK